LPHLALSSHRAAPRPGVRNGIGFRSPTLGSMRPVKCRRPAHRRRAVVAGRHPRERPHPAPSPGRDVGRGTGRLISVNLMCTRARSSVHATSNLDTTLRQPVYVPLRSDRGVARGSVCPSSLEGFYRRLRPSGTIGRRSPTGTPGPWGAPLRPLRRIWPSPTKRSFMAPSR
jgi:hypothetical protein